MAPRPILATGEQLLAEQAVLRLLRDGEVIAIMDAAKAAMAASARGQSPAASGRIEQVVQQWTAALILDELSYARRANPAFTQGTDTTPRRWMGRADGHWFPGNGKAGDNPDMLSRSTVIDGAGQYEVLGQIDPARPPVQIVASMFAGTMTHPAPLPAGADTATNPDAGIFRLIGQLDDRQLNIAPDGSFRILLGGDPDGGPWLPTEPIPCSFGFRPMMLDWATPPMRLSIRRLDTDARPEPDLKELRQSVLADLAGYLRFWASYGDKWLGGIAPNALVGPVSREGGWGFLAATNMVLEPGEALVITMSPGDAAYMAFQFTDPWMNGPEPGQLQTSLNLAQAVADADGRFTFVVCPVDPGVANWIDTCGMNEGFGTMRWQGFPAANSDPAGLLHDCQVVPLSAIASLPGIAQTTPEGRSRQLAHRRASHASRLTAA